MYVLLYIFKCINLVCGLWWTFITSALNTLKSRSSWGLNSLCETFFPGQQWLVLLVEFLVQRSLKSSRQSHESVEVFLLLRCQAMPHLFWNQHFFCSHFIQYPKPHFHLATCLCQHTINCAQSFTIDLVKAVKGLFPVSSACVDDKRGLELQDFLMFPSHIHLHLFIHACSY